MTVSAQQSTRARGTWLRSGQSALVALLFAVGLALQVGQARADDLSDFEQARSLYERRNYAAAASAFYAMVGTDPPRVSERLLLLESRKYLAASLLFVGRTEEAELQFRLLLRQEPHYSLDPLAFPTDVVALFEQVKAATQEELARAQSEARKQQEDQQRQQQEQARLERERFDRLLKLASASQTITSNSRWVATIPFGVGQFQNGHRAFGLTLAFLESIAAATSIVTYIGHQQLADNHPPPLQVADANRAEAVWRGVNFASFGIFAGLALVGIIDAHVRFVPGRVTSRPRQLPPDLERWAGERKLTVSGLRIRF